MSDKRQSILSAAQTLLAQYGFHGFSMKQLACEAGVAAGTVYLYFRDKEALIQDLHRHIVMELGQEWLGETEADMPLPELFQSYWLKLWDICINDPSRVMCKSQFDSLPPESHQALVQNAHAGFQPLYELLRSAREQGLLKPVSDEALLSISMESCVSLARKQVMGVVNLNQDELRQMAQAAWDAIASKP